VSHGSRAGYLSEFVWDGTKDYGAYLSIPAVVDFWMNTVGLRQTREYCMGLLKAAEAMFCKAFDVAAVARGSPFMTLIRLPLFFRRRHYSGKFVQDTLHTRYSVEVPVKEIDGVLYIRISAFVNNTLADYERVRDALFDMRQLLAVKRQRETGLAAAEDATASLVEDEVLRKRGGTAAAGGAPQCGGCGIPLAAAKTRAFEDSDDE
jgi:hypothetical protein